MSKNLSDNFSGLSEVVKKYVQVHIDLFKLSVLAKATKFTSKLISALILILLGSIILLFVFAAFIVWYGETYHDYLTGLLLAVGILLMLAVLFLVLRKPIITSFVLRSYSAMLFEEAEEEEKII